MITTTGKKVTLLYTFDTDVVDCIHHSHVNAVANEFGLVFSCINGYPNTSGIRVIEETEQLCHLILMVKTLAHPCPAYMSANVTTIRWVAVQDNCPAVVIDETLFNSTVRFCKSKNILHAYKHGTLN